VGTSHSITIFHQKYIKSKIYSEGLIDMEKEIEKLEKEFEKIGYSLEHTGLDEYTIKDSNGKDFSYFVSTYYDDIVLQSDNDNINAAFMYLYAHGKWQVSFDIVNYGLGNELAIYNKDGNKDGNHLFISFRELKK
jgi:hypothetical protein